MLNGEPSVGGIAQPHKVLGEVDALAKARFETVDITDDYLLLRFAQAPAFALSTKQWSRSKERLSS